MSRAMGLPFPIVPRSTASPPYRVASPVDRWYFSPMSAPRVQVDHPVPAPSVLERRRAAMEEAKRRPLPSPEERARLMALVAETGKGTMTAEDFQAKLAARRPAAAE